MHCSLTFLQHHITDRLRAGRTVFIPRFKSNQTKVWHYFILISIGKKSQMKGTLRLNYVLIIFNKQFIGDLKLHETA